MKIQTFHKGSSQEVNIQKKFSGNMVMVGSQTISLKIKLFVQVQSQEKGEFTFRESPSALFDWVTNALPISQAWVS